MNLPRLRRLARLLVVVLALVAVAAATVPALGAFLVVDEPLGPGDAIVVLDGGTPTRELEAAALWQRRLAPVVLVTRARDPFEEAHALAGEPTPQERAVRVLLHRGVPAAAIVRLDRTVENTLQELTADFDYARARGFRRVIIVTSPVHTRRVRIMWSARFQSTLPALVHPTPYERFDAARWWRARRPFEESVHELIGIAHFYIGSPLPTFDESR